jgi:hypothetical protein
MYVELPARGYGKSRNESKFLTVAVPNRLDQDSKAAVNAEAKY